MLKFIPAERPSVFNILKELINSNLLFNKNECID